MAVVPPSSLQALLFDIDKTLTTRYKVVTPRTERMLEDLVAQDKFELALCTGRSPVQASDVLAYFPPGSLHIFNGGGTLARTNGDVIWEKNLPGDLVQEIAQQAEQMGAEYEFEHEGKIFTNEAKVGKKETFFSPVSLDDWSTPLLCLQWINEEIRELVKKYPQIQVKEMMSSVNGPYFDLTAAGVTKATALQKWSEAVSIPLDQVAGFGDSQNDLEFLSLVGWPVAMGNAPQELKALAKDVAGDCDDDGLAQYVEGKFLV
jgi:Cof subfamily protein (haloacid dehalogenase superfamily)